MHTCFFNGLDGNSMDNFNMVTLSMEPRKWSITIYNNCDRACKTCLTMRVQIMPSANNIFHSECKITFL